MTTLENNLIMKFLVLFITLSFFVSAQESIEVNYDINKFNSKRYVYLPKKEIQFKDYGETWFSTVIDLVNLDEIPPLSDEPWGQKALLVSIFPDSTIILGVDPMTKDGYRPLFHGLADIINPSRTPSQWASQWADVIVDSISIPFVYTRNTKDSILDTLFVDYIESNPELVYYDLNDNEVPDFGEFLHQPLYHSDISTNELDDGQVFRTDTILLSPADSSFPENIAVRFKEIDVNDSVFRNERYGVFLRFKPGYEWSLNDTIKNFNELFLLTREQKENELPRQIWPLESGFCSYSMSKDIRYNKYSSSSSFSYYLTPGIIPLAEWQLEHLMISYKLTSNTLYTNDLSGSSNLKLYPNPVNDILNIKFSTSNIENVELYIFDVMGKVVIRHSFKVNNDFNLHRLNIESLNSGIYSIKIGDLTKRFLVK